MVDIDASARFVAAHARLIDRRRLAHLLGDEPVDTVLRALDAYRNPDGGVAWLEPDLRTPASQPSCALYALDLLGELDAGDAPIAGDVLDWVQSVATDEGGVPFVLGSARDWPHAPWYAPEEDPEPSLLMTAGTAGAAHRLGLEHPWLDRATAFCWERIDEAVPGHPYTVHYVADFLDAVPDRERAAAALGTLAARFPADGRLRIAEGTEGEALCPLDVAPRPGHAARRFFTDAVVESELDALADDQRDDGGWTFAWQAWNPAVAWEWRGSRTVDAVRTLAEYGRLELPAAAR